LAMAGLGECCLALKMSMSWLEKSLT